ncbi:MAG: hypothetical protein HYU36_07330 [Planctomycetes bacterium]|nr:hypothetical protein [Planctomycetota bacterium]
MERLRRFKWIDWNIQKVRDNDLEPEEVEEVFDRVLLYDRRPDDSFETFGLTGAGRACWVIWRWDEGGTDIFADLPEPVIFVITAYEPSA